MPHLIWDQISYESYIINKTSRFQHDEHASKDFYQELIIKRKPLYYMINNVYPYLVINLVNLISFFLPFALQASISNFILFEFIVFLIEMFNSFSDYYFYQHGNNVNASE